MHYSRPVPRVLIATPFGHGGSGGIDRLTDLVISTLSQRSMPPASVKALTTYGPRGKFLMPFVFLVSLVTLSFAKLRGEVDVLHINVAGGGSAYRKAFLAKVARFMGIPYVVHIHGSRFHTTWPSSNSTLRRVVDAMLLRSAAIVVLGQYWFRHIADNLPVVLPKIYILSNATPRAGPRTLGRRKNERVRITSLGVLGARKGTSELIEALAQLADRTDWEATIAGDGNIKRYLKLVAERHISGRVHLPGWLSPDEVNTLLDETDIFVLPSFAENLPMSILEAFAHGVAVISTPVGAIPEIVVPDVTGIIVPVGDVDALADALLRLIETPEL